MSVLLAKGEIPYSSIVRFVFVSLGVHPDMAGGADRYVADLAETLVERGHLVDVICPKASPLLANSEVRHGVTVNRFKNLHGPFWFNWLGENALAWWRLQRLLSRVGPAVVVLCHSFLWPAALPFSKRTIFSFHGPWAEEFLSAQRAFPKSKILERVDNAVSCIMRTVEGNALSKSRETLVVSEFSQKNIPTWHPSINCAPQVVGAGVNLNQFRRTVDRGQARTILGIEEEDFALLTVRRLAPRMGLVTLIEAIRRSLAKTPNLKVAIAGKGQLETTLRERISKYGLESNVRLLGYVPEEKLASLYSAFDCSVIPSTELEGFGLSAVESLACGTPVIASDLGGLPEVLRGLDQRLLFKSGSATALASKITEVADRPEWLPSPESCFQYASEQFSWEDTARYFEHSANNVLQKCS